MNYWVTTDTHFGHDKMVEYCGRPHGFEANIRHNHHMTVCSSDVLIHLGDVCIGNDEVWHNWFMDRKAFPKSEGFARCRKWLLRGNHDKKTSTWYMSHGWDFIGNTISLEVYGLNIMLSHLPQSDCGYDINIHGHFHNSDHRRHEPELVAIKNDKQKLIMLEHIYSPLNLRRLVRK